MYTNTHPKLKNQLMFDFLDALPEIIGNNCRSCDTRQKANAERVAKFIQTRYPNTWRDLVRKYAVVV